MNVEVVHTIADVDEQEWNALCGAQTFTSHRWLRLAEAVLVRHKPRYILLRQAGRLVAAAVGTIEHRLRDPALQARFGWLVHRTPCLHIGTPITAAPGLLVRPGEDEIAALDGLLRAVRALTRHERCLFHTIDNLADGHNAVYSEHGQRISSPAEASLAIGWDSFDGYERALPIKKRKIVRRIERRGAREGIVIGPLKPEPGNNHQLAGMVGAVLRRYGEPAHYTPTLLTTAQAIIGGDVAYLGAFRDDHPIAFCALLRSSDEVTLKWFGRDYERSQGTGAYAALIAGCVRHAIELRVARLRMGSTAFETKRQFGAALERRASLLGTRSTTLDRCMRALHRHVVLARTAERR